MGSKCLYDLYAYSQKRFGENPSITSGAMTYRSEQGMVVFSAPHGARLGWWREESVGSSLPLRGLSVCAS